jgi:cell division protein FtsX
MYSSGTTFLHANGCSSKLTLLRSNSTCSCSKLSVVLAMIQLTYFFHLALCNTHSLTHSLTRAFQSDQTERVDIVCHFY